MSKQNAWDKRRKRFSWNNKFWYKLKNHILVIKALDLCHKYKPNEIHYIRIISLNLMQEAATTKKGQTKSATFQENEKASSKPRTKLQAWCNSKSHASANLNQFQQSNYIPGTLSKPFHPSLKGKSSQNQPIRRAHYG